MPDQPYSFPQSRGYAPRDISSAYFSGGSVFPSYEQMQSSSRYSRQPKNYSSQNRTVNYRA